jgi:hypothetical protein
MRLDPNNTWLLFINSRGKREFRARVFYALAAIIYFGGQYLIFRYL